MSAAPVPMSQPSRPHRSAAWLEAKAMWAGLAIVSMWLAVLFVGLFGGDIVTTSGGTGTTSTVPAAVALAPFALVGTIFVARWGFAPERRSDGEGD